MKKILLAIIPIMAFGLMANAQIITYSYGADTAYYGLKADNVEHKAKFKLTNATPTPVTFEWRVVSVDTPGIGWASAGMCDWFNCYAFDNTLHSIVMEADTSHEMYVYMKRRLGNTIEGCSDVLVEYREVGQPFKRTHLRHSSGFDLNCWPTATRDLSKIEMVDVYPNPTTNILNLNMRNKDVKIVQLSNLIGKQIQRVNVSNSNGSIHQLSLQALPKGIYILQYRNEAGKILGVSRITKN